MSAQGSEFYHLSTEGDFRDDELVLLEGWPEGFPEMKGYCMAMGDPAAPYWADDSWIYLRLQHPGIVVPDLLGNTDSYLLVSPRLKDVIARHCGAAGFEYLPFTLGDHRRRALARDLWCINPLDPIDCLDVPASGVHIASDGGVSGIDRFVIDRRKVAGARPLFRILEAPTEYVVGGALGAALAGGGFENLRLEKLQAT